MKKRLYLLPFILMFIFVFAGCQSNNKTVNAPTTSITTDSPSGAANKQSSSPLTVRYIDVGQADCMLIAQDNCSMLIDAGNNTDGQKIVDYLKSLGISKLDYVVGTHPHADHIGGMDNVIKEFEVGQVIMPRVSHTSKTYEDVLKAVQAKGLKITGAKSGQTYSIGNATANILSPVKDKYDNLNEYSIVINLAYGDTSFLFTGDIESVNENELLSSGQELKATVFKVPHHGSGTSNTESFITAIQPKYGIICVGKDNSYGHPHKEILKLLEQHMKVYRTDQHGTVTITSDGKTVDIQTEKSE